MTEIIKFNVDEHEEYSVVSFEIEGIIRPSDLKTIKLPKVEGSKGIILNGRVPIWFYCYLAHLCSSTKLNITWFQS